MFTKEALVYLYFMLTAETILNKPIPETKKLTRNELNKFIYNLLVDKDKDENFFGDIFIHEELDNLYLSVVGHVSFEFKILKRWQKEYVLYKTILKKFLSNYKTFDAIEDKMKELNPVTIDDEEEDLNKITKYRSNILKYVKHSQSDYEKCPQCMFKIQKLIDNIEENEYDNEELHVLHKIALRNLINKPVGHGPVRVKVFSQQPRLLLRHPSPVLFRSYPKRKFLNIKEVNPIIIFKRTIVDLLNKKLWEIPRSRIEQNGLIKNTILTMSPSILSRLWFVPNGIHGTDVNRFIIKQFNSNLIHIPQIKTRQGFVLWPGN